MDEKENSDLEKIIKSKAQSRDMYKITFTTDEGKDIEYEIIMSFKSKSNKKIYYIMTDNTRDSNNELNIMAFYIFYNDEVDEPSGIDESFYPVTSEDELKMVMDIFNKVKSNI